MDSGYKLRSKLLLLLRLKLKEDERLCVHVHEHEIAYRSTGWRRLGCKNPVLDQLRFL